MKPLILAIDTAGERCAVALACLDKGELLARADPAIGRGHAEWLMGMIGDVLQEAKAGYGDLAKIAVTIGPGSFTGLRVGVATARGLSLALGVPSVGVTTLEALAEPFAGHGRPILSVLDAKRGEVYAALHAASGEGLGSPTALSTADLPAFAEEAFGSPEPLFLVGSGADIAAAELAGHQVSVESTAPVADIAAVARIGCVRAPADAPRPLYLRSADAKPQASYEIARRNVAFSISK